MKITVSRVVFLAFIALMGCGENAFSQTDTGANKSGKRSWYLSMGMDQKISSFAGKYKYSYEGEYNQGSSFGQPDWIWKKREWQEDELLEWSRFYSTKIDLLLSHNENWKGGLSYNFGALVYEDTLFHSQNISFIAITAIGEYSYYFNKIPQGSLFAFGSVAAGFYRETAWNGGPGRELFGELRAGLGYHNKGDWMFRVWAASNYLNYREHTMSPVFDREQTRKVDISLWYWGLGIRRQFELVPE